MNDELDRLRNLIESYLNEALPGEGDPESRTLFEAIRYTIEAPGKRVRPVLLLLACMAVNGDEKEALPYACAIELIHNYSLIHDDLPSMDNDDFRRGKLSNHKVFGEAMAILAGDGMLSAAFELIHNDYLKYLNDSTALERRIRAGAAIAAGCGCNGMVAGQVADIEAEGMAASLELLEYIHMNKTAAIIRASVTAGAYIGGAGETTVSAIAEYGENIGLAFQIKDDILDFKNEKEKASYPVIRGLGEACARMEELTDRAIKSVENTEGTDTFYTNILIKMAKGLALRTV